MSSKTIHMVTFILLVVGGLNWLLVGVFNWELGMLTDQISPMLTRIIYVLVGLSAVYELVMHKSTCRMCGSSSAGQGTVSSQTM